MINPIAQKQLEQVCNLYPMAHLNEGINNNVALFIPGVILPKGYTHTICTIITKIPPGYPAAQPDGFWLDIVDIRLKNGNIILQTEHSTRYKNTIMEMFYGIDEYAYSYAIPGFPNWTDITWFSWHLQQWNPNKDTLQSWVNAILYRLGKFRKCAIVE